MAVLRANQYLVAGYERRTLACWATQHLLPAPTSLFAPDTTDSSISGQDKDVGSGNRGHRNHATFLVLVRTRCIQHLAMTHDRTFVERYLIDRTVIVAGIRHAVENSR